ncbi:MAG: hypothetical protein JWP25_703 [Bradyrhizobium sp.]|nr:hypothetical protein [Bradyrhizobium sp.]
MTAHGIPVGIQDTEGCVTDPPFRSEINVAYSAFWLRGDDDSSHSPRHANWALERHVNQVLLLGQVRRNLTGADSGQIRCDVRRARRLLLKWHIREGFELIDRVERGQWRASDHRRVRQPHAQGGALEGVPDGSAVDERVQRSRIFLITQSGDAARQSIHLRSVVAVL